MKHLRSLLRDESGLVSAMEMTLGIMLAFVLIVSAVLMLMYAIMGVKVDNAALALTRAATQFQFPAQVSQASAVAKEVFSALLTFMWINSAFHRVTLSQSVHKLASPVRG